MNTARNNTQTPLDHPVVVLSLTPSEIFDACGVGFETGFAPEKSHVSENEESVVWRHDVAHERTGNSCRIAALEYEQDGEDVTEYVVELEVGDVYVDFSWRTDGSDADMEHVKKSAHRTFMKVCTLIGVNVGYHLVTNPSPY